MGKLLYFVFQNVSVEQLGFLNELENSLKNSFLLQG